jgi:hypothetical protein
MAAAGAGNGFWPALGDLRMDIDNSIKSSLFQEQAGTTPVVDPADPVGLEVDTSGNGEDLFALDPQRPNYVGDLLGVRTANLKSLYNETQIPWVNGAGVSHTFFLLQQANVATGPTLASCIFGVGGIFMRVASTFLQTQLEDGANSVNAFATASPSATKPFLYSYTLDNPNNLVHQYLDGVLKNSTAYTGDIDTVAGGGDFCIAGKRRHSDGLLQVSTTLDHMATKGYRSVIDDAGHAAAWQQFILQFGLTP